MLNRNGKYIASLMLNGRMLSALWKESQLIWQSVRSCFGSGIWRSEKPWLGEEKWKSNK